MSLGTSTPGLKGAGGGSSLPAPQVTVGVVTASVIPLSWGAVDGALDYSVYVREIYPDPVEEWTEVATGIVGTSQDIQGLDPDPHRYQYRVDARLERTTSTAGTATMAAAPDIDPYRDFAVLAPFAANMGDLTLEATTDYTMLLDLPPIPAGTTWTGIRVRMAGRIGSPVAPTGVAVAICNGGNQNAPTLNDGPVAWITGTSLAAPPAGTDDEPALGAVCATLAAPSQAGARSVCVRLRMPAGAHTGAGVNGGGVGTNTDLYPVGVSAPKTKTSGDLTDESGWGEAFGNCPWYLVEYVGLSSPVLSLLAVGDSHLQGYASVGSNGNRGPFGALEDSALWATRPNINIVNFGRMGHTTAQISARMTSALAQMDFGGVLRQRASINDHDDNFDVPTETADASWSTLQADAAAAAALGKLFIPFSPAGANGWASGWFERFTAHVSDEIATFGANGVGVVYEHLSILAADGSYKAGYAESDGAHPTVAAQAIWGGAMWPTLADVLTGKGYTP